MIFDTSYSDKKITRQIDQAVGHPYSWKERWKMGGIGSKRMVIQDISEDYRKYLNAAYYHTNANIELRPKGILVHFRHKLQAYTWVMPFDDLEIASETLLTLKAAGKFLEFDPGDQQKFIAKLISLRQEYLELKK